MNKSILFLSAVDFKEMGSPVIRKTPQAFAERGWIVHYVVARDRSRNGNYFYEPELPIPGVHVHRLTMPLGRIVDSIRSHTARTAFNKIRLLLTSVVLAIRAHRLLETMDIGILYGMEVHGALAARFVRYSRRGRQPSLVTRFCGTKITEAVMNRRRLSLLGQLEHIVGMRTRSDVCIMTDDGTRGDQVLKQIRTRARSVHFWVNGADRMKVDASLVESLRARLELPRDTVVLLSMCRLERWKRVDRSLQIVAGLVRGGRANYIYLVGGDGVERGALEHLAADLGISPFVVFLGAVPHSEVAGYIALADFFLSMNDLSNVGNPLLEAIRARRIIVTVATGDTTRWIVHRHNGLIYEPNEMLAGKAVVDIQELVSHASLREELLQNLLRTERNRLWGWDERLSKEVDTVQALLSMEN